ncbi:MAG: efflux RND transporter periplasmic adaptor subunit [Verrucomicrobia bacterium]|nr:efflux RND transporter periplasmic adaptor subunit [Verrucomicrobiota bacterium]
MKRISVCSEHTLSPGSTLRNRDLASDIDTDTSPRSRCSWPSRWFWLVLATSALSLAGCHQPPPATTAFPPANVTVSKPVQKEVVNWNEFTGRTAAINLVNVTARVSGYIVGIPFKEGDIVHKGDLLYQIDPRPYQDAYDQALGQLKQAQANQQLQDVTFERQERLRQTNVIAKEDYDTALSNKNQAAAQVVATQAAVNAAGLNLEFTRVTSPIDGRVGRQLVNIGNLVQADSTQLTTVVSVDPIYAYFSMDELSALTYQRLVRDGKLPSTRDGKAPVYLQLQDETGFPHEGTIDFSDNTFDTSTGTLLIRATFPNPDGFLTPGNFVRVRVASSPKYQALLVADRAIGSDQDQSFVYVIDPKNIAQVRHITIGQLADGLRVVKSGLQPGDVVIINGILKVRPNSPVKPQPGTMEQFSSNDISLNLKGSQANASASHSNANNTTH